MVRVCETIYPIKFSHNRKPGFYLEPLLKMQIDILLKNIEKDWDFTIIISGGGEVRVGKSVLALQIAAYWTYMIHKLYGKKVPFELTKNLVFDGRKLIQTGNELGQKHPFSPLIYDEAGADLEGKKMMQTLTQDVLDYFRECGQYNLLNIIVLPEFFDLPKGIALSRSIFLLDVYYIADSDDIFQRGYFNFYSRPNKKYLYLNGKRTLNYSVYPYDFHGRFYNFYPFNEQEYRNAKQEAMRRRENRRRSKFQMQRDACWYLLAHEGLESEGNKPLKLSQQELAKRMEGLTGIFVAQSVISDGIRHFAMEKG